MQDRSTPIFSPYAGRVTGILAKPGEVIQRGQLLFVVEATDMVQAQNDFIAAITSLNKARSALNLGQIVEKRSRDLYAAKAVPLKEVQSAQDALIAAQNDMRSAETALAACARNRLRILGATKPTSTLSPRKRGGSTLTRPSIHRCRAPSSSARLGQDNMLSAATSDPVFLIGDLSDVWLTAFVREPEIGKVAVGAAVTFTVLAYPSHVFTGKLDYVAAAIDAASRLACWCAQRLITRPDCSNPRCWRIP